MDSLINREMQREALKGLVSLQMWCPVCKGILDVSRAVTALEPAAVPVFCGACWDKQVMPRIKEPVLREVKASLMDGRELYAKEAPDPTREPVRNKVRKADVVIGQIYAVKVSGRIAPVRIYAFKIFTSYGRGGGPTYRRGWYGHNLNTDRDIAIRSAAKLRNRLQPCANPHCERYTAIPNDHDGAPVFCRHCRV